MASLASEQKACLGILMLESRFPRIVGDIGNPSTWPFPVRYRVVKGASPDRVVRHQATGLLDAFCDAADQLVAEGVDGISTTCGFLVLFQDDIARRCGVPVATSSLMQAPFIERLLPPGKRVGILTISAEALSPAHLDAAGVAPDTPIVGADGGAEFSRVILGDLPELDTSKAEQDITSAGRTLVETNPEVGAILFECTNMAPYAHALRAELGLPVFDVYSFLTWFHSGLAPRNFNAIADRG